MRPNFGSMQLTGVTNLAVQAAVRRGFVEGFETITYVERLRRLLNAVNHSRLSARESSFRLPIQPDTIGRFAIIRNFRYAIVPPAGRESSDPRDPLPDLPGWRLSLNVTFDGGWEPYMRVIYRDIGSLLDALFCHCDGYGRSHAVDFDSYCRWVRRNEISGGLFYVGSPVTQGDQEYLASVERMVRERGDAGADYEAAAHGQPSGPRLQAAADAESAVRADDAAYEGLRALKGLYRLTPLFPANREQDDRVLMRFAQVALGDFVAQRERGLLNSPRLREVERLFGDELEWLQRGSAAASRTEALDSVDGRKVQPGIVEGFPGATHGALVLLRLRDGAAAAAAQTVAGWLGSAPSGVQRNLAFTWNGLRAFGLGGAQLDPLPREFVEGMEARAGLLGDLRGNHPDNWQRPLRNWPAGAEAAAMPVDLAAVHGVATLRLADPKADPAAVARLHDALAAEVAALDQVAGGLEVLSVQPLHSQRRAVAGPAGEIAEPYSREHFGFADGLSQPVFSGPPGPDRVQPGELLFQRRNDRGDGEPQQPSALLQDGSYLVVRKLRQHVDRLEAALEPHLRGLPAAQAEARRRLLLGRLMGRGVDGHPQVRPPRAALDNNFHYAGDVQGELCPFHSHVRRTNPRDGRGHLPRILRRGMSYGPRDGDARADRGLVFMAYCGSLSEQFEVLQRWVAGDNSSGGHSAQSDPFLGVPVPGERRVYRCLDEGGRVLRIDLGELPIAPLQWGLYAFALSTDALARLPDYVAAAAASGAAAAAAEPRAPADARAPVDAWRGPLEDPAHERVAETWRWIRDTQSGVLATSYGLLAGSEAGVRQVLADDGQRFSVAGYGRRMKASIGLGYLGLDPHQGHAEQAPGVNRAIAGMDLQAAFDRTRQFTAGAIARCRLLARDEPGLPAKLPLDLQAVAEAVIATLCRVWFGLPDADRLMVPGGRTSGRPANGAARCPGHLQSVSRYVFSPRPGDAVLDDARSQGQAVLAAVMERLARDGARPTLAPDGQPAVLTAAIREALAPLPEVQDGDPGRLVARTVSGILLGFAPTVLGNFLRVLEQWSRAERIADLQQALFSLELAGVAPRERADRALRQPLLAAMCRRPVPEMIWRTAAADATLEGRSPIDPEQRVVLGLASAIAQAAAAAPGRPLDAGDSPADLLFGGAPGKATHACPGRELGLTVMLGLFSGVLESGSLRPAGSPTMWLLVPRVSPPAPAAPAPG